MIETIEVMKTQREKYGSQCNIMVKFLVLVLLMF